MEKNKSKGADELHEALIDEYTRLFIGPHRLPVQPYESWWVDGKLMGKSLLKVKRDYRKAGIVKARDYAEPEDHVAFELKENGAVEEFLNSLMKELPPLASIDKIEVDDKPISRCEDFEIINSSEGEKTSVTPVDTAICEECVRELYDEDNRRYLNSSSDDLECFSPGLGNVGVYLPYSGFHYVLFHYLNSDGIIMTSANVSGEPMVIRNEGAFELKADYFLLHNRKIVNRIDDSVVRCYEGKRFFLRKSRGFIPVAIKKDGTLYSSQFIGNTFYYPTLEFLASSKERMMEFLGLRMDEIDAIGVDMHPRYSTKRYGKNCRKNFQLN